MVEGEGGSVERESLRGEVAVIRGTCIWIMIWLLFPSHLLSFSHYLYLSTLVIYNSLPSLSHVSFFSPSFPLPLSLSLSPSPPSPSLPLPLPLLPPSKQFSEASGEERRWRCPQLGEERGCVSLSPSVHVWLLDKCSHRNFIGGLCQIKLLWGYAPHETMGHRDIPRVSPSVGTLGLSEGSLVYTSCTYQPTGLYTCSRKNIRLFCYFVAYTCMYAW